MKRQPESQVDTSVDTSELESVNRWLAEIGGRIKQARQALGLTQEAFALEAGAKSKSGLQDNERGKSMPGGYIIGALAKRGINTNWIFTGAGEMRVSDRPYGLSGRPSMGLAADIVIDEAHRATVGNKVNLKAFTAILGGLMEAGATFEKALPAAYEFYQINIDRGLITPEGIGESKENAA